MCATVFYIFAVVAILAAVAARRRAVERAADAEIERQRLAAMLKSRSDR